MFKILLAVFLLTAIQAIEIRPAPGDAPQTPQVIGQEVRALPSSPKAESPELPLEAGTGTEPLTVSKTRKNASEPSPPKEEILTKNSTAAQAAAASEALEPAPSVQSPPKSSELAPPNGDEPAAGGSSGLPPVLATSAGNGGLVVLSTESPSTSLSKQLNGSEILSTIIIPAQSNITEISSSSTSSLSTGSPLSTISAVNRTSVVELTTIGISSSSVSQISALPTAASTENNTNQTSKKPTLIENDQQKNRSAPIDFEPANNLNLTQNLANNTLVNGSRPILIATPAPLFNNNETAESNVRFPSQLKRPRVTVIGFTGKPVRTFNLTEDQVLYQMKVFWTEPKKWRDDENKVIDNNNITESTTLAADQQEPEADKDQQKPKDPENDRLYELFCWLGVNGGFERELVKRNFTSQFFSHAQWYSFQETEDESKQNITANCGVRAVNAFGVGGNWSFSVPAFVREAPVFLRGFENVNVKGWSREEVSHFTKTAVIEQQKRRDSPVASGRKSKSGAAAAPKGARGAAAAAAPVKAAAVPARKIN